MSKCLKLSQAPSWENAHSYTVDNSPTLVSKAGTEGNLGLNVA